MKQYIVYDYFYKLYTNVKVRLKLKVFYIILFAAFRPKLSKVLSLEPEKISLRSQKFYDDANIDFLLEKQASQVNIKEKFVSFFDGQKITYDKLLLATG